MCGHQVGSSVDVLRGGPQQANACGDQHVLATIVVGKAAAMRIAVVLKTHALIWVEEIDSGHDASLAIANLVLRNRTRKSSSDQEEPESRLHRRLGGRLG